MKTKSNELRNENAKVVVELANNAFVKHALWWLVGSNQYLWIHHWLTNATTDNSRLTNNWTTTATQDSNCIIEHKPLACRYNQM